MFRVLSPAHRLGRLPLASLILFLVLAQSIFVDTALARRGEAPVSPVGAGPLGEPTLRVSAPDVATLRAEDAEAKLAGVKTLRYAEPVSVSVSPASNGRWSTLSDGTRMWRMEIVGPGATDINLGFETFELPYGAKLWVISTERDYYEGPYTYDDNEEHGQLWVPVVPGSRAIIELQVPAKTKFEPRLELTHVGYGYLDVFNMDGLPKQGSCNNDVVCPVGDAWRDQIQSVAAYSLGGSIFCTGQMVMNATNDFKPYFLTAYHCGLTPANAPSLVVYWNFESPTCGQLSGGSLAQNQTGATWRTSRQDVDQCLVELDDFPEPAFNVFYSGWDNSGSTPQGSVGIHHPNGDEKAISFNDDPLTTGASCILGSGTANSHWFVDNWEDGTTEPGSSGSGLWDPDTGLLVGFLSGGQASCSVIGYDCYGRFSVAWDGATASSRLRDWLDPLATGVAQVQGSYPTGDGVLLFAGASGSDDCNGTSDGVIEPGESVSVTVEISAALNDVGGIVGTLASSTPGVTVTQGSSPFPTVAQGATASNTAPFEIVLDPGVACFSDIELSIELVDGIGQVFTFPFTLPVGQLQTPMGLPKPIPDGSASGTTSVFQIAEDVTITDLDVRVAISHTWVGDLTVRITSPAGTQVTLLDRPGFPAATYGCNNDNMDVTFDDAASLDLESYCPGTDPWASGPALPAQALSAFNGESTLGQWTLFVSDSVGADTGQIESWELITTPGISAGSCDVCDAGPTTVFASTAATGLVSVTMIPDGSGDRLDDAQTWDGVPGGVTGRVDATVVARVEADNGDPWVGFDGNSLVLGSTEGSLAWCAGPATADGPTDVNGETTFSGALTAGGVSDLIAGEQMTVTGAGLTTVYDTPGGLDIRFNSPDLNGDSVVNLQDVGEFAAAFNAGYEYAIDYVFDGSNDLADLGRFATALGSGCTAPIKRPALAMDSSRLSIRFDGVEGPRSRSLVAGVPVTASIVLEGDLAQAGILGWEAHLAMSPNVRVLETQLVGGVLNALAAGDFAVATTGEALRSQRGVLELARVRLTVTDENPAFFSIEASPVASQGAQGPAVLVSSTNGTSAIRGLDFTVDPVAALNHELEDTPRAEVTRATVDNVPNPFNPSTEIRFALPQAGDTEIRIFDVAGRLVRSFDLAHMESGTHAVVWRGDDANGRGVVSGVYFAQLVVDGVSQDAPHKMVLLK